MQPHIWDLALSAPQSPEGSWQHQPGRLLYGQHLWHTQHKHLCVPVIRLTDFTTPEYMPCLLLLG